MLHRDSPPMTLLDHLPEHVPPLEGGVLLADLRRIVEEAHVRLAVADDRLRTRADEHLGVLGRVELREEPWVPIRDVHVNDCSAIGVLVPGPLIRRRGCQC